MQSGNRLDAPHPVRVMILRHDRRARGSLAGVLEALYAVRKLVSGLARPARRREVPHPSATARPRGAAAMHRRRAAASAPTGTRGGVLLSSALAG